MIKNTANQTIGAQMISAIDGSAFTDSVTVYVCGDAGTQAIGAVDSGACIHEGNGYHTYAPTQAETDYDLVAFTFIGDGAISVTVQVYTVSESAVWTSDEKAQIRSALGIDGAKVDATDGQLQLLGNLKIRDGKIGVRGSFGPIPSDLFGTNFPE